jgi:peptide/nickel transport system substrate-binding protein
VALVTLVTTLAVCASAGAQTVRIPLPRDDGSLTPYTFKVAYPLVTLVYDTLMWRDADGVPQPWLARSVTRVDPLTVRVRLQPGVRWHDGRPLTAEDVAFTFRFVARREHPRFTPQLRDVRSVEARGPGTVVIHLRRASLGVTDQPLADLPILPRHLWEDLPRDRLAPPGPPVGSGPFRLLRHDRQGYRFEANREYFKGDPAVDRVDVPIIPRLDRAFEALRRGRADAIFTGPDPRDLRAPGIDTVSGPSYSGTVLALNTTRPPLEHAAARRAVAQALDLRRIARAAAGAPTAESILAATRGYVSPASPWALERSEDPFDLARARVNLAEQGVSALTVLAPTDNEVALEAGRQVVLALQRAGVRAQLRGESSEQLARSIGQDRPGTARFEAAIAPAPALASHDPAFLAALFGTGATLNYSGYSSPAFDQLTDRIASATTAQQRRAAADAAQRQLLTDAPVVPLFYADAGFAYRRGAYDGWRFVKGTGILDKQSFLTAADGATPPPAADADPVDRAPAEDASLLPFIFAGAALLAAGTAVALLRRRRAR